MNTIPQFKPLYAQVRDALVQRLIDGTWLPGQMIPSEMDLAKEIKVSQGTVRKALDAMTAENLLVRRQGRGTFVSQPEESRILFQFFRLTKDMEENATPFPQSEMLQCELTKANPTERKLLRLQDSAEKKIWRMERLRRFGADAILMETLSLPASRFTGFDCHGPIPNNVYEFFSAHWGITIARADERLKAIAASNTDAAQLGVEANTPLLCIERVGYDLENTPVELRISRCLTTDIHYRASLR